MRYRSKVDWVERVVEVGARSVENESGEIGQRGGREDGIEEYRCSLMQPAQVEGPQLNESSEEETKCRVCWVPQRTLTNRRGPPAGRKPDLELLDILEWARLVL